MSQTFSQRHALALHREQQERTATSRRLNRAKRIRRHFERQVFVARGSWLFAAMSIGAAVGLLVERFAK